MKKKENVKKKSKKGLIIALALLLLLATSVGYAYLTQTLTTQGTASVAKTTWNIKFANPEVASGSISLTPPTLSADSATMTYSVNMTTPGQYYDFTADVVNSGTVDAKLSVNPTLTTLTAEQQGYLDYSATYSDGTQIKANDTLRAGESKKIRIRVAYKLDVTAEALPTTTQNVSLTFAMNYIQA